MRVTARTVVGAALAGAAGAWAWERAVREPPSLKGSVALITGGSRGLGLALARELAAQGCRIALVARDAERLAEVADDPRLRNADVLPLPCDVSDENQVKAAVDAALRRFGRLDILVNNAGVIQVGPAVDQTIDDYREAADVMYWGPVYAVLATLPHFRRQGCGSIVNIASIGGKVSVPHLLPYNSAKFALVGFSEGLATELRGEGIHVLTVVPGLMRTGSHLNAKFGGGQAREFAWFGLCGNLPGLSISPAAAARSIVRGIRLRKREVVISAPAKWLCLAKGLLPGVVARGLEAANRLLPDEPSAPSPKISGRRIVQEKGGLAVRAVERLGRGPASRYQRSA